jgi:hypothetical protein
MASFQERVREKFEELNIRPGDIYEDCGWHPVVCVEIDAKTDDINGVSLVDGSYPRNCSLIHCGIRKLSVAEAWNIRVEGPPDIDARARISPERRWWRSGE